MKTFYRLLPALGLVAASGWPSGAGASPGADVADWALPEASLAVVFRGADTLPARLDALSARFAGAKGLMRDIEAVRALDVRGLRPGGELLAGMDPKRGLALFVDDAGRIRLVVGATDAKTLRQSIGALAAELDAPVVVTDEGFGGPVPLPCTEKGGLMICDSGGLPEAAPGRPEDLGLQTWLTVRLRGAMLLGLPQPMGSMVQSARVDVQADDGQVTARASVTVRPEMMGTYTQVRDVMRPTTGASATDAIHPRSPGLLKLSLDAPKLVAMAGGGMPPEMAERLKTVARHWTGELALSFVGGFGEPVLTLGLGEGSKGGDLIDAVLALLPPDVTRPEKTADALIFRTTPDPELGGAPMVITVPYRAVGAHLLVGIDRVDLQRVERERGLPPTLPPALAARGAHGSFLAHMPAGMSYGMSDAMRLELPPGKQWPALLTWLGAEALLMDGIWSIVSLAEDAMTVELGWSRL